MLSAKVADDRLAPDIVSRRAALRLIKIAAGLDLPMLFLACDSIRKGGEDVGVVNHYHAS